MENHNSGSVLAESNLSCFLFCLGCRWQSSLEMYLFTYRCLCFKILKTKGVFNDSYMCIRRCSVSPVFILDCSYISRNIGLVV